MEIKIQIIAFISLSILLISFCSKHKDSSGTKQSTMKMEVSYSGDIQSQVAVLTFLAINSSNGPINILNKNTGIDTTGLFLQNEDFLATKIISFHSFEKVTSASIMLSLSHKVYETVDNQTLSHDQVSDGTSNTPKDFDYTVTVQ